MQYYVNSTISKDMGNFKITGYADNGASLAFEVSDWESSQIWPHD